MKELKGWDKIGGTARKRNAVMAHSNRVPLTSKILDMLRDHVGHKISKNHINWVALRPAKDDLLK